MRATDLLIAIGAVLGSASADVVCNTEALHHAAEVIADTKREGFAKSVIELCSTHNVEGVVEDHFGSIILGLNRTCSDCDSNDCAQHLNSVIEECVTGQELGGGIAITDGMVVEVSIDTSLSEASKSTTLGARRVRKAKSRTKIKTKATTRPKHKKVKSKTKSRAQPEKTKTKPKPKKTKAKPKKTKSKACPIKNKKTPGKKSSKNGLRSLIQTLLPRAGSQQSSSDVCGPFDEDMHIPAGWGETYFGFTEEIYSTMTKKKLLNLAKKAWDQAHKKKPTSLLLVAALYVPNHGLYFGTIPHKGGEDRFKRECASFTALWDKGGLSERHSDSASASQQLYHAEDAAMLYAFKKGAFGDGPQFPPGSMLVTFGEEKARGTPPKHVAACHPGKSNILPTCSQVLGWMGIGQG